MTVRELDLTEHLRRQQEDEAADLHFEAQLHQTGLLDILKESGVLSDVHNPNPYDPVTETMEHDQWWRKHPEEGRAFRRSVEDRQQALRFLHVGSKLPRR